MSQHFNFELVRAEDPGLIRDVALYLAEEDLKVTVTTYTLEEQSGKKTLRAGGYTMEDLTVGVSPELRAALLNVASRLSESNLALVLSRPQDNLPGVTEGDSVLYVFFGEGKEVLLFSFKIPAEKLEKFLADAKVELNGLEGKGHFNQILKSFAKNVNSAIPESLRPGELRRFLEDYQQAVEIAVSQKLERAESRNLESIKEIVLHSYKEVLGLAKKIVSESSGYGNRPRLENSSISIGNIKEEIHFGLQSSANLSEVLGVVFPPRQESDSATLPKPATCRFAWNKQVESPTTTPVSLITAGKDANLAFFRESTVPSRFEGQQRAGALHGRNAITSEATVALGFFDHNHERLNSIKPKLSYGGLKSRYFNGLKRLPKPPQDNRQKLFTLLTLQVPATEASYRSNLNPFTSSKNRSYSETKAKSGWKLKMYAVSETLQKLWRLIKPNIANSRKLNDTNVVANTRRFSNITYLASFLPCTDDFSRNSRFLQEGKKADHQSDEVPKHLVTHTPWVSNLRRNRPDQKQASSFSPQTSNVAPILQVSKLKGSFAKRANGKLLNSEGKETVTNAASKPSFLSKIACSKVLREKTKLLLNLFLSRRGASYHLRRLAHSLKLNSSNIRRMVSSGTAKSSLDFRFTRLLLRISVALAQVRLRFAGKKYFPKAIWLGRKPSLTRKIFWKPSLAFPAFKGSKFILKLPKSLLSELLRKKILVERNPSRIYLKSKSLLFGLNRIGSKVNQFRPQKYGKRLVLKVFLSLRTERIFNYTLKFFKFFALRYTLSVKKIRSLEFKKQVDYFKLKHRVRFKSRPLKINCVQSQFSRSKKARQNKLVHKSFINSFARIILFLLIKPVVRRAFLQFFVFFAKKIRKLLGQVDENFIFYLLLKLQIKKIAKDLKREILIKPISKISKPARGEIASQTVKVRQGRIFRNLTLQTAKV